MNWTQIMKTTSARKVLNRRFYSNNPGREAARVQTHHEMALGMKIRRVREGAGMTQRQLAEEIGTQPSAISRIEDAGYDRHSLDTLQKVAKALGMLLIVDFVKPSKSRHGAKEL